MRAKKPPPQEVVLIGPLTIPVVEQEGDTKEDWVHGEFKMRPTPHIVVSPGLTGLHRPMTVLHEAIHGIAELYGIPLKEQSVRTLEVALTEFLRDNKQLVQDLQV